MLKWWRKWRLRRALRQHARWKAEREAKERMLDTGDYSYRTNPYNRNTLVRVAGKEAYYCELVEQLMREP